MVDAELVTGDDSAPFDGVALALARGAAEPVGLMAAATCDLGSADRGSGGSLAALARGRSDTIACRA